MVRLLTLVVAVWLVSLESCYGLGEEFCTSWPNVTYDFKEYDYNVEECNALRSIGNEQILLSNFSVKLYDSKCFDDSFYFFETINETHWRYTLKDSDNQNFRSEVLNFNSSYKNGTYLFILFFWTRLACFSTYVNQVSMSERCSIEELSAWDAYSELNSNPTTWQEDIYNRIDCNCTWGCNITSSFSPESEEKDESFPLWAILVISIGGAIILGMAAYFLVKKEKANIGVQIERVPKGSLLF